MPLSGLKQSRAPSAASNDPRPGADAEVDANEMRAERCYRPPVVPVVWLCGAPGADKSATGWALFQALGAEGVGTAYLDIDQLGMLYPASTDDPSRYHLKAKALAAVVPNYANVGAEMLIVSGVVDPLAPGDAAASYPSVDVTFVRLAVDDRVIRERILARGWSTEEADEAVAENAAFRNAPPGASVVDTTDRAVSDVVADVRALVASDEASEERDRDPRPEQRPAVTRADLVVVYGPRAVGSSSVAFAFAMSQWRRGALTGFVDLEQLSFVRTADHVGRSQATLGIANVATMREVFDSSGATRVVVSAHLDGVDGPDRLRRSADHVTAVRLRADERSIEAHIDERVEGNSARLAGDDLLGASSDHQVHVLRAAVREQQALDAAANEDLVLDVSGCGVAETVIALERLLNER